MNLFALEYMSDYNTLSEWATANAQSHSDQHVNKLVSEVLQMLNASGNVLKLNGVHNKKAKGYVQHPCTIWSRTSLGNWKTIIEYAKALNAEGNYRNPKRTKDHESWTNIKTFFDFFAEGKLSSDSTTPFAQAMPTHLQSDDPVASYRHYYSTHKAWFAKRTKVTVEIAGQSCKVTRYKVSPATWKRREAPSWWNPVSMDWAIDNGVIKITGENGKQRALTNADRDVIVT